MMAFKGSLVQEMVFQNVLLKTGSDLVFLRCFDC